MGQGPLREASYLAGAVQSVRGRGRQAGHVMGLESLDHLGPGREALVHIPLEGAQDFLEDIERELQQHNCRRKLDTITGNIENFAATVISDTFGFRFHRGSENATSGGHSGGERVSPKLCKYGGPTNVSVGPDPVRRTWNRGLIASSPATLPTQLLTSRHGSDVS